MDKDILIKSIAFNRADPDQLELLAHASKRTNFSSYIKRLIQRDMEVGKVFTHESNTVEYEGNNEFMEALI